MKTQMRFQKIFMLVSMIVAALCVVFALIFCSGTLFQLHQNNILYNPRDNTEAVPGAGVKDAYLASQSVSNIVLILGIVLIVIMALNYMMGTAKRRKYYVTNYVAIGVTVAFQLVVAIVIVVLVLKCQNCLNSLDLVACETRFERRLPGAWHYSDWTIPVGYAMSGILIVNALGFVLNLVWKIKLMQGEKKLLESGLVKEVA